MIIVKIIFVLIITIVASYILFHNISSPQAQYSTKNKRIGKIGLSIITLILLIIIILENTTTNNNCNDNYSNSNTDPTITRTYDDKPDIETTQG